MLIALWSYVIFTKGSTQPIDPSILKNDDLVRGKRTAKNRSKNKWGSPERKQEREQAGNKEAKTTREVTKHASENTTGSVPQASIHPPPTKVETSRNSDVVSANTSVRSKQKGKRKAASRQEQQQEEKVVPDDVEGGWKVQLSRQQLRVLKEQQRQTQQSSRDHQDEAVQEKETITKPPNENQSGSEDTAEMTADKARDSSQNQKVEVSVHCDNLMDIERALKEAADSSSSPEETETLTVWGTRQHKKRTRQKSKPDPPPTTEQPSDQAKDQSQEDWVIL
eukprot:Em0023g32a